MKRKHPSAPAHDLQPAATQATSSTFTPIRPQLKTGGSAAGPAVYQVNHSIQPFAVQRASVYYQTEKTTPLIQREPKDKAKQTPLETCLQDPQAILPPNPGKGQGLLFSIDQELVLNAMLGAEGPAITASIRKNPEARRFACKHGLSGIAALLDTSHGSTFDTAAAEKALREAPDTYNHAALSNEWRLAHKHRQQLEDSAEDLGVWAQRQADTSNHEIPNAAAALDMQAPQLEDIEMMINSVQQLQSLASGATALLDTTAKKLGVIDTAFSTLTNMKIADDYPAIVEGQMAYLEEQLPDLEPIMERLSFGRVDLSEVTKLIRPIKKQCYDARWEAVAYKRNQKTGKRALQDQINTIKEGNFKKLLSSYEAKAQSLRALIKHGNSLLFVLRYFKAHNDPSAVPPTEADLNKYNAVLESLNPFAFFTNERGSNLMRRVVSFVQQQTAMRLKMQSRTKSLPGMVPTLAEAETYFASLNDQTNETVRDAYEQFAQAWFQHRGAASLADLEVYAVEPVLPCHLVL